MWLIVNAPQFKEQQTKEFFLRHYPDVVRQVYLPLRRMSRAVADGNESVSFRPLIHGMFFVKVDDVYALRSIITNWGYFKYEDSVRNLETGTMETETFVADAHLLCKNVKAMSQSSIISSATIPDGDMERFIFYNERVASDIDGLSIVDRNYGDLVAVNDTIRLLSGPMAGWEGVVKQVKHKGKKDRHLLVRFGNNHCLNISNIRKFDMQVVHEATSGAKAEAVGCWRAIDQIIGYLQANNPLEDAPAMLRQMLKDFLRKPAVCRDRSLSAISYCKKKAAKEEQWQEGVLCNIGESMRSNFRVLAKYFHSNNATLDAVLREYVPDAVLRPFLTPTSGVDIPESKDYAVFHHNGLFELVLRCNLRGFFRGKDYDADRYAPVFDEDYDYYAHVALFKDDEGKVEAVVSWGDFYDSYESQGVEERRRFVHDLATKHYPRLHSLLTVADPSLSVASATLLSSGKEPASSASNDGNRQADGGNPLEVRFERVGGIGGFSMKLDVDYDAMDVERMARAVASQLRQTGSAFQAVTAAAVEMWQGTRLLVWRQLLQRHVLLHKVPVADLPSVITHDAALDAAFHDADGKLNIPGVSAALDGKCQIIDLHLRQGQLPQAVFTFLSVAQVLSFHFPKDELYNYLSATFNPDTTLSSIFSSITAAMTEAFNKGKKAEAFNKGKKAEAFNKGKNAEAVKENSPILHLAAHLHRGMVELREQDSWKYFKFPSFLKHTDFKTKAPL